MASEAPRGLTEDWPDAFGDEERDYLHDESRRRLRETIEFGDQQEAKALALVRISLILIAASGIFGDLRVEAAPPAEWDWLTVASLLAILSSVAVGAIAVWLLHPRAWDLGSDVRWLAQWSGASTREMKTEVLRGLVEGFDRNNETVVRRGERLVWMLWAVAIQTLCIVLVQVAAAIEGAA